MKNATERSQTEMGWRENAAQPVSSMVEENMQCARPVKTETPAGTQVIGADKVDKAPEHAGEKRAEHVGEESKMRSTTDQGKTGRPKTIRVRGNGRKATTRSRPVRRGGVRKKWRQARGNM